jgi:hypothetical protein
MAKMLLGIVLGVLISVISFFFIFPNYADYRATAETYSWLAMLTSDKSELIKAINEGNRSAPVFEKLKPTPEHIKFLTSKALVIKGGREGQVVVLFSDFDGDKEEIFCITGPTKAAPQVCERPGFIK